MIRFVTGMVDSKMRYRKATPKEMAQRILAGGIQGTTDCLELDRAYPEMTEREVALVWDQVHKIEKRLYKILGV